MVPPEPRWALQTISNLHPNGINDDTFPVIFTFYVFLSLMLCVCVSTSVLQHYAKLNAALLEALEGWGWPLYVVFVKLKGFCGGILSLQTGGPLSRVHVLLLHGLGG